MDREIKFRAYVTVHGISAASIGGYEHYNKMIPVAGYLIDYILDADGLEYSYLDDTLIALMQYTGLKDKNGVEIYEGDILSTDLDRPYLIVEFRNGAFMFQCHDNGKDYYDFMATTDENSNFTKYREVIGNIYENPELLKE